MIHLCTIYAKNIDKIYLKYQRYRVIMDFKFVCSRPSLGASSIFGVALTLLKTRVISEVINFNRVIQQRPSIKLVNLKQGAYWYKRCVDDSFLLFKSRVDSVWLPDYINSRHSTVSFTFKHDVDGKFSFLDSCVQHSGNKFISSVLCQPTLSGVGISFFSLCYFHFEVNSIKTLLFRAYNLSFNFYQEFFC